MCGLLNAITAPFGLKLTPGGPYPDKGNTDLAKNASAPLQAAGQGLLNNSVGALPGLYSQYAAATGIANPYAASDPSSQLIGMYHPDGTVGAQPSTNAADPYGLSPQQQAAFNTQASIIQQQRKNALANAQASLSSHGLSNSGAQAMLAHINKLADDELQSTFSTHVTNAHNEKVNALSNLLSNAGSNAALGGNLITGNVNTLENAAKNATTATNQGNAALGGAIGAGLGLLNPSGSAGAVGNVGGNIFGGAAGSALGAGAQPSALNAQWNWNPTTGTF